MSMCGKTCTKMLLNTICISLDQVATRCVSWASQWVALGFSVVPVVQDLYALNPFFFPTFWFNSIIRFYRSVLTQEGTFLSLYIKYAFGRTEGVYSSYKQRRILNFKACVFLQQFAPSDDWVWHLNISPELAHFFLNLSTNLLLLKRHPVLCKSWHLSLPFLLAFTHSFFFHFRKHALNCHRMKPALFSVLCEIKEKTGALVSFLASAFQKNPLYSYQLGSRLTWPVFSLIDSTT